MNKLCKNCANKEICRYCGELQKHLDTAKEAESKLKQTMSEGVAFSCTVNVTCNYFKPSKDY